MRQYDFEQSVGYWLTVTTQALHRTLNEELGPTGITYRQTQVIGWLVIDGELTVTELAGRLMIEPPTLVGILDRMERMGWIVRAECDDDRRCKLIRLTPAAEPVWEEIVKCLLKVRGLAVAGLTDEQVGQLRGLLRQVHENLNSPNVVPG